MTKGIYEIVNEQNGKAYVGGSVNIEQRWKQHRNMSAAQKQRRARERAGESE